MFASGRLFAKPRALYHESVSGVEFPEHSVTLSNNRMRKYGKNQINKIQQKSYNICNLSLSNEKEDYIIHLSSHSIQCQHLQCHFCLMRNYWMGRLLTKRHSRGSVYYKGSVHWKKGAKSNPWSMHQSIPVVPWWPTLPSISWAFAHVLRQGKRHLKFYYCPGARHLPTPGTSPGHLSPLWFWSRAWQRTQTWPPLRTQLEQITIL